MKHLQVIVCISFVSTTTLRIFGQVCERRKKDNVDKKEANSSSFYNPNPLQIPVNPKVDFYFYFLCHDVDLQ